MKKLTLEQITCQFTEKELYDFITERDKIQTRQATADELGCTKYTVRQCAKLLGIKLPQGRPIKQVKFKED